MSVAIIAISRPGAELAERLAMMLPNSHGYVLASAGAETKTLEAWDSSARHLMTQAFAEHDEIVVFGSVGMTVRLIAPLLVSKQIDPAVVVVDDASRFAISVLSGHVGGGNAMAERVAAALGAQPVITTASDALSTLAVDMLGRELGWRIDDGCDVTAVSAAVVNGEPVGLLQEAGDTGWWPAGKSLPPNITRYPSIEALVDSQCRAALVITDRWLSWWTQYLPPFVVYRPRNLVLGIGCNRGTPGATIASAVSQALLQQSLVMTSVRNIATIDAKADEPGLLEFAQRLGVPLVCFSPAELDIPLVPSGHSDTVRRWVGTGAVSEPAALLSSGATELLVPKIKTGSVTVAVARIPVTSEEAV